MEFLKPAFVDDALDAQSADNRMAELDCNTVINKHESLTVQEQLNREECRSLIKAKQNSFNDLMKGIDNGLKTQENKGGKKYSSTRRRKTRSSTRRRRKKRTHKRGNNKRKVSNKK